MELDPDRELPPGPAGLEHTSLTRFQIKTYATEAVVYDTASGDTHYLAPLALDLFRIIESSPGLTQDEIDTALTMRLGLDSGAELTKLARDALVSLSRIGLLNSP